MNDLVQGALVQNLFAELLDPANYSFDQRSLWHFGAALIIAACTALVVYRERGSRISRFFAAFTTLFLVWAAARGLMRLTTDPALVLFVARRFYVLLFLSLPFLYQFTMMLLRIESQRASAIWINWGFGVFMALLCVASPAMIEGVQTLPWGLEPQFGFWGYVALAWIAVTMVSASLDAAGTVRRLQPGTVERRRIAIYCVAMLTIYLSVVDFLPALGFAVYPWAFLSVCAFTLLTAWLTLRYGLVEVSPQMAAQEIAGLVRGALLILDRDGAIQYCNPFAESVLGRPRTALLGAAAPKLLGEVFHPERLAQLARLEGREAEQDLLYQAPDGAIRDLSLAAVAVRDAQQRDVAFVCLLRDVTEQKRVQQQRTSGLRDALTGLPGRPPFLERLDAAVRRAAESKDYDFAVCFIGLDRLKVINEDLGYAAGDRVLAEVARRLRKSARAEDTVARLGGDEFGVLLDGTSYERLQSISARLQQVIAAPMRLSDHDVHVSASIGIAGSTFAYGSGAEILRAAGTAMSQAKRSGGGVHILTRSERSTQRTKLESELRHALEARQFQVHYQPVLDLAEKRVAGFEALVRWQHPERGLVLPGAFIELAEQIGLSRQLDLYVMEQACADLARFQRAAGKNGKDTVSLSFNMAEGCLRDAQFTERVSASLERHGLNPGSVRVEVLERVAMITPLRSTLARLRSLGVGLAVDDFGVGYSSLSRLHELPLTVLKVDREFVQAMAQGRNSEKVIVAILALGGSLGLTVIAEGAAQMREARRLRDLGCRYVQGFYFSQAVPADQALSMVQDPARHFGTKFAELDAAWMAASPPPAAAEVTEPNSKLRRGRVN